MSLAKSNSDLYLQQMQKLLGNIHSEDYHFIDCFLDTSGDFGVFIPAAAQCGYSTSPEHTHPSYMFVLNFDDKGRFRFNGKQLSSIPGMTVGLSPDVPHQELPSEDFSRFVAIFIERELFENSLRQCGIQETPKYYCELRPNSEFLKQSVRLYTQEFQSHSIGKQFLLKAIQTQIIHAIIRQFHSPKQEQEKVLPIGNRLQIDMAIEWIHTHFDTLLKMDLLAEKAAMSRAHFSREFKKYTQQTPSEYLQKVRLQNAKKLLGDHALSIGDVASKCGFPNTNHFSTVFSKVFQINPRDYRKNL